VAYGKKTGGGSRKGVPNKGNGDFRQRLRAMVAEMGADPFRYMASVVSDPSASPEVRLRASSELARYLEPQLKSTDVTLSGNPDAPLGLRSPHRPLSATQNNWHNPKLLCSQWVRCFHLGQESLGWPTP
jgi:hypothetical protein